MTGRLSPRTHSRLIRVLQAAKSGRVYELPGAGARWEGRIVDTATVVLKRKGLLWLSKDESPLIGCLLWRPTEDGLKELERLSNVV